MIEKDLLYTKDHDWIKVEGNKATVGIDDYAQHALGEIVYVELPELDSELAQGDTLGVVESVKAASDILAPISGKVLEINEELTDDPGQVNQAPYDSWFAVLEISDPSELEGLMDAKAYEAFLQEEE